MAKKQKIIQRDRGKQIPHHTGINPEQSADGNTSTPEESRHFQIGWWGLLFFVGLGIMLEGLIAFRIGWYMDVNNDTRRLMLRLGHAHGTLLCVLNIAFAATLVRITVPKTNRLWASRFLVAATLLIPGGFILGGVQIYDADPGLGIVLLPAGAILLLFGIFQIARNIRK